MEYRDNNLRSFVSVVGDAKEKEEVLTENVHDSYRQFCQSISGSYDHGPTEYSIEEGRCVKGPDALFVVSTTTFMCSPLCLYVAAPVKGTKPQHFDYQAFAFLKKNILRKRAGNDAARYVEQERKQKTAYTHCISKTADPTGCRKLIYEDKIYPSN